MCLPLHLAPLRFISPHFTSLRATPLRPTSPRFTSLHCASPQFTSLHFTPLRPLRPVLRQPGPLRSSLNPIWEAQVQASLILLRFNVYAERTFPSKGTAHQGKAQKNYGHKLRLRPQLFLMAKAARLGANKKAELEGGSSLKRSRSSPGSAVAVGAPQAGEGHQATRVAAAPCRFSQSTGRPPLVEEVRAPLAPRPSSLFGGKRAGRGSLAQGERLPGNAQIRGALRPLAV